MITIIILNVLSNFFDLTKNSMDPYIKQKPYLLIIFYVFGRFLVNFGKTDISDFSMTRKLSVACFKFSGPFEHTFLYKKLYKQINKTRNWLRNILVIFFLSYFI